MEIRYYPSVIYGLSAVAVAAILSFSHWTPFIVRIETISSKEFTPKHLERLPITPSSNGAVVASTTTPITEMPTTTLNNNATAATAMVAPRLPANPVATAKNVGQIENPDTAAKVIGALSAMDGVLDAPIGTADNKIVTVFFDPRCPYCHAAFEAMHGKIAARYIPVIALGSPEEGKKLALSILSAPDRLTAMIDVLKTKHAVAVETKEGMVAKLDENFEAFASIFAAAPHLRPGVPTLFMPQQDGRLTILVGYEPGDDKKVQRILSEGGNG